MIDRSPKYLQSSPSSELADDQIREFYERMRKDRDRAISELAQIGGGWFVSHAQYLADVALNVRLELEGQVLRAEAAERERDTLRSALRQLEAKWRQEATGDLAGTNSATLNHLTFYEGRGRGYFECADQLAALIGDAPLEKT